MPRISTIAENGIFNINKAQGRYSKSSTELTTGNRNLSRDINSSIIVGQLDNKAQAIKKVREGLIYMKNMFTTAHTGTQALLSNLSEQQNLIRAAGNNASDQVLAQLKTSLDLQIAAFTRTVTETNFDGKTLLNGSGAAGAIGTGAGEAATAGVIHVLHSNSRMGISMTNIVDFTIAPLNPSQIYINTDAFGAVAQAINGLAGANLANAKVVGLANISNGIFAASTAIFAAEAGTTVPHAAAAIVANVVAPNAVLINNPANRVIAETVTNCARTIVSAQNTKIEAYLSILDDAIDSLSSDLITTNSTVSSFANTDYMQSSEEGKNALQAILSGMAVLSVFQSRMNNAILEVIKA